MAQPFLPPPPSSTRRRQRRVSTESPAEVQQWQPIAAEPSISGDNAASRLVDFDNPALVTSASSDEYTWAFQDSHPSTQPSLFESPAPPTQSSVSQLMSIYSPTQSQAGAMPRSAISSQPQPHSAAQEGMPGYLPPQSQPSPPTVHATLSPMHPVQRSAQPALLEDFGQQQNALQPQVDDWASFTEATSVSVSENQPDDIDFQISQMEQELAQLSAFATEFDGADYEDVVPEFRSVGTQEQKVEQVPATGIYDLPMIPPPPTRTTAASGPGSNLFDMTNVSQYSHQQQQQLPILFDFDTAFPIGNAGALSQAPFPPQATTSAEPQQAPPVSEPQYTDISVIRQRKSMKEGQQSARVNPSKSKQITHKAIHNFMSRHDDELDMNKGDPVSVELAALDGWYTGTNLKTGRRGIFPASCVLSISHPSLKKALGAPNLPSFPVKFLGTVPLKTHKGMKYLSAAITKVVGARQAGDAPPPLLQMLEVSNEGLRVYFTDKGVIDNSRRPNYFPLEKVTYVGAHPQYSKFFGFICESPSRAGVFVCSVFVYGSDSKPICDAISRSFKKLKGAYLDHANPTYDFYAE